MSAAAAAEAREALVPLWEQHPAAAETFRAFCTGMDKMSQGDWQRLAAAFQFENKFGLSERESEIIFHACSSSDDASPDACLSLAEFCSCLVQVAHLTSIHPRPHDAAAASKQDKSRALASICHFLQNPGAPFEREAAMALHVAQVQKHARACSRRVMLTSRLWSQLGGVQADGEGEGGEGASATSSDALFDNHNVWLKGMRSMMQNLTSDAEEVPVCAKAAPGEKL